MLDVCIHPVNDKGSGLVQMRECDSRWSDKNRKFKTGNGSLDRNYGWLTGKPEVLYRKLFLTGNAGTGRAGKGSPAPEVVYERKCWNRK